MRRDEASLVELLFKKGLNINSHRYTSYLDHTLYRVV